MEQIEPGAHDHRLGAERDASRGGCGGGGAWWTKPYFLDADHINLKTVDRFVAPCDFFTLDVAEMIGKPAAPADVEAFVGRHPELVGEVTIPSIAEPFRRTGRL